ncbi:hypothetical protein TNCV_4108911 [Trichonephila clavipes]|nr:hypothetical protein TNCV_4108911 [Trichonephila clavipes]
MKIHPVDGLMWFKSVKIQSFSRWFGFSRLLVLAQVPSSSLYQGLELRVPIPKENGACRRTIFDLYHSFKESDIVNFIKIQRIKWADPVVRMDGDHTTKKVFNTQPPHEERGRRTFWIGDVSGENASNGNELNSCDVIVT